MTMMSLRRVLPITPENLARVSTAAVLLTVACAAFGQAAPAVSTIVAFSGSVPSGGVVEGTDGALYGTGTSRTIVSGGVVYRSTRDGLSVKTLHQFQGSEGSTPAAGLLEGSDGLLYGTTSFGAADEKFSTGIIFRLAKDGTGFTVVYRFAAYSTTNVVSMPENTDGAHPDSQLIEGTDGDLYGVTTAGGVNGTGVVFRVSKDGSSFQLLHEFSEVTSGASDNLVKNVEGVTPVGRLLYLAQDDYLYGTATNGGVNGRGTIFRLHPDGSGFEVVHDFSQVTNDSSATNADGARPIGGLTDGQNGSLYGVANLGGAKGVGTLYSLDPVSLQLTVLHDFDIVDGAYPSGGLTLGLDGRIYATTQGGGTTAGGAATTTGTIFSMALDGTGFTKLYSFDVNQGANPNTRLLQLDDTTFVGVTPAGGKCGQGVLYSVSLTGATVVGNTTCGQKKQNKSGGGATDPFVVLICATLGLVSRRRRG